MVTHPATNQSIQGLCKADRTGYPVFNLICGCMWKSKLLLKLKFKSFPFEEYENPPKIQRDKTYNNRDSLMVTHPATNQSIQGLCKADRTGYPVFSLICGRMWRFRTLLDIIYHSINPPISSNIKLDGH